jgi:hypothetical protein
MRALPRLLAVLLPLAAAACAARAPRPQPHGGPGAEPITLRLDYGGAEALLDALARDSLSDADVDSLLRVPGVNAMAANVTRFIPRLGTAEFRTSIRHFARTRERDDPGRYFRFDDAWAARGEVRALVQALRADERAAVHASLAQLGPYLPATESLDVGVFFVAGGVSEGFVLEGAGEPALYANLVRAGGDLNRVLWNLGHEVYHVAQKAAQRRAGLGTYADAPHTLPPAERMLAEALVEGTANLAADPLRSGAPGPAMDRARERYRRHAEPARAAENFAAFDRVLGDLRAGRITWDTAYVAGFSDHNDARFYFVGYQMAQAVERYCGAACIGRAFAERPAAFFRRYIALCEAHRELTCFAPETRAFVASLP